MNSNKNIIFYSRKCRACNELINILNSNNLMRFFIEFCVDDNIDKLPPQIKMVPTLIVSNVNKPLVAGDAFKWVNQIKFINNNDNCDNNSDRNSNSNNIIGYNKQEMEGISDTFCYRKKNAKETIPHSFSGLTANIENAIHTQPIDNKKMTHYDQKLLIEKMKNARNEQDEQYSNIMKEQQFEYYLQNEKNKLNNYR